MNQEGWDAFADLVVAVVAAVQAIDSGEPAIGKMYLEAALLQINEVIVSKAEFDE